MSQDQNCIAVIQARMTSSRLPGKSLMDLSARPLLFHIAHRLKKSTFINDIVIATSINKEDDAIYNFAKEQNLHCVRASEHNLLDRYKIAFEQFNPDYIIQVCGDSPIIDIEFIDSWIENLSETKSDYSFWRFPEDRKIVLGVFDVMSSNAFKRILEDEGDFYAQEYVSGYIKQYPDKFKISKPEVPSKYYVPEIINDANLRLSIDTPQDLNFFEKVYELSGAKPGDLSVLKFLDIIESNPELINLNSMVHQKKLGEKTTLCLFVVENFETEDISKLISYADSLRSSYAYGISFLIPETFDSEAFETTKIKYKSYSGNLSAQDLKKYFPKTNFDVLFCSKKSESKFNESSENNLEIRYIEDHIYENSNSR